MKTKYKCNLYLRDFVFAGVYLYYLCVYTWLACDILLDLLWRLAGSPSLILSMLQPHDSMVFRDSLTGQQYASLSCTVTTKDKNWQWHKFISPINYNTLYSRVTFKCEGQCKVNKRQHSHFSLSLQRAILKSFLRQHINQSRHLGALACARDKEQYDNRFFNR